MVVAQHQRGRHAGKGGEDRVPGCVKGCLRVRIKIAARRQPRIPGGQETGFGQHRQIIKAGDGVGCARVTAGQRAGYGQGMQRGKHVHRRAIKRLLAVAGSDPLREDTVAEIFQQDEALVEIKRVELRGAEAVGGEVAGDGRKRAHVLGQMHDGAVALAALDRRAVRAGRGVHQDRGLAVPRQPLIQAGGGIPRDGRGRGRAPAGLIEEGAPGVAAIMRPHAAILSSLAAQPPWPVAASLRFSPAGSSVASSSVSAMSSRPLTRFASKPRPRRAGHSTKSAPKSSASSRPSSSISPSSSMR